MSCPHTETTAVLAAFGEAPEDFESHLSACSECRQVVSEHLQTLSMIEPAMTPEAPGSTKVMSRYAIGFLMAAAVLLAIQFLPTETAPLTPPIEHASTTTLDDIFNEPIDDELAALEMELALFNLEES